MPAHAVVSSAEWLAARKALLAEEKAFTRQRDELNRRRLELPWERVEKTYLFNGPTGQESLGDLFAGRRQLLIYHFMLGPGWAEGCPSCSYISDHFAGMMPHLNARDITLGAVSRAPWPEIEAFQRRMGWKFHWVSSAGSDFNFDFHVSFKPEEIEQGDLTYNYAEMGGTPTEELPGISAFFRDPDGSIYHAYSSYARGLDMLVGAYNYLDIAPLGRNEDGLAHSMSWVRHHDRYENNYLVDPLAAYAPPKGSCCCK
ncbi:DUF899 domain-containing protein [Lacipirellula sp.]|uniref:DUF899 domain-containing protein n=1 Tax=Lacipirellula sp. TaxID=2691419 RepID=UPI003D140EC4